MLTTLFFALWFLAGLFVADLLRTHRTQREAFISGYRQGAIDERYRLTRRLDDAHRERQKAQEELELAFRLKRDAEMWGEYADEMAKRRGAFSVN